MEGAKTNLEKENKAEVTQNKIELGNNITPTEICVPLVDRAHNIKVRQ